MTEPNISRRIEILRLKRSSFAVVYTDHLVDTLKCDPILNRNPGFAFKKDMMWNVHHLYNEIRQMKSLSIEDVYATLDIDLEPTDSVKCVHRRNHIKGFREEISKILEISMQQIQKNVDRVDISKITYKIFQSMQSFSSDKPFYIASQWFLGNSNDRNETMKQAFEFYTLASNELKSDTAFCLEALLGLLKCTQGQVLNSFRTLYLDNILDHIYQWYFIFSESSYEFLIFMPEAFDDVRDFLLDIIDTNPFAYYIKNKGSVIEKITDDECCLDADSILYLSMDVVNQLASVRELSKKFDAFYQNYRDYSEHGIFDCHCYNVTEHITSSMIKSPEHQEKIPFIVEDLISQKKVRPILTYKSIISPKNTFTKKVVKRDILEKIIEPPTSQYRKFEQQELLLSQEKSA